MLVQRMKTDEVEENAGKRLKDRTANETQKYT